MFNEYKDKIKKLKEDLIYAVKEKYKGELEIEDVADEPYLKMVLNQDKEVFNNSNDVFANAAAQLLETLDNYINSFSKYDGRTLLRNKVIIEETLDDLCRTIQILTLSIRKNNAAWQVNLDSLVEDDEEEVKKDEKKENKVKDDLFAKHISNAFEELEKIFGKDWREII